MITIMVVAGLCLPMAGCWIPCDIWPQSILSTVVDIIHEWASGVSRELEHCVSRHDETASLSLHAQLAGLL